MKNIKILALVLCVFLVFGLSFIVAEGAKKSNNSVLFNKSVKGWHNDSNKSLEKTRKMNYGACASSSTKIKNSCFKEKKEGFKTCEKQTRQYFKEQRNESSTELINKTDLINQTKERKKACKESYKNGLTQCKQAFNASKQSCVVWRCQSNQTFSNGTCIRVP
jgi:hypothetical protein